MRLLQLEMGLLETRRSFIFDVGFQGRIMGQRERVNSTSNDWETVPWDTSDKIADEQLRGFQERSVKPIHWNAVRDLASHEDTLFGLARQWFVSRDVEFYAEHDGEQLLLIQLTWHGFPDPPEWGLVSRLGAESGPWSQWGYFAHLPASWSFPRTA